MDDHKKQESLSSRGKWSFHPIRAPSTVFKPFHLQAGWRIGVLFLQVSTRASVDEGSGREATCGPWEILDQRNSAPGPRQLWWLQFLSVLSPPSPSVGVWLPRPCWGRPEYEPPFLTGQQPFLHHFDAANCKAKLPPPLFKRISLPASSRSSYEEGQMTGAWPVYQVH